MNRYIAFFISILYSFALIAQTVSFKADTTSGCGKLEVTFTNTTNHVDANKYFWEFGFKKQTNQDKNPSKVVFDSAGVFPVSLKVYDIDNQLLGTHVKLIKVRPRLNAYFLNKDTGGRTIVFRAVQKSDTGSIVIKYRWNFNGQDGTNYSSPADITPVILKNFPNEGIYRARLKVSDNFGCADSLALLVGVNDALKAPNVFTPNNDGVNDFFSIITQDDNIYALHVFTRNGQMVYKSESPSILWDGNNISGDPLETGTYYFSVETIKGTLKKSLSGYVMLIRK